MTQDYSTEAAAVAEAMNAVYENKQTNKKNDITGDFSSDNASYPTVKAVKSLYGSKVTSWSSTVSDSNIPSEKLVKDSLDGKAASSHTHASGDVTNSTAFDNILAGESTTLTLTDQAKVNAAINAKLGTITGLDVIVITSDKGTASASTMGKLYIVSENSKVNVYYTVQEGSGSSATYSWQKMDTDILDEYSVAWSDVTGKPDFGTGQNDFARGNHTHSEYMTASTTESEIGAFATALASAINPSS